MKTPGFIFFTCFLFSAFSLFAAPFDMIMMGDPVFEDLRYLSLESGKPVLSFTPPLAPAEAERFLDSLDVSDFSAPALEAYERAKKALIPEAALTLSADVFSMSLNINAALEARARFNKDISWYPEYPKIAPVLSLPFNFYFADSLQLYFEPIIAADPEYYANAETLGVNVPWKLEYVDLNMPLRAFIAAGGSWWNFQLGRDRISYGTGYTGNLSISDNPAFYEFARLSFFTRFFKYSVLINQMPLEIKEDNDKKYHEHKNYLERTTQRHFYLHRLDFTPFNALSVGLMEGLMVGNSALEIRYLNPFTIFHNYYSSWDYDKVVGDMTGSFFSVEANWNIFRSMALYGQFAMNQLITKYKAEHWPDQPPNGLAFLAGTRFSHSFDSWGSVFFVEFLYTDPYAYMSPSPFSSFIQMRRLSVNNNNTLLYYIAYPRDTIALSLGTKFFKGDTLNISGEFSWISRGEHNKNGIIWDWEQTVDSFNERTPTGIAENKFTASLEAQWKLYPFLALKGGVTGIFSRNNRHINGSDETGGQAAFSVSFMY
jgi:hypothetical protein